MRIRSKRRLANYTGIKKGYCHFHGVFYGSTNLNKRKPSCPKCLAPIDSGFTEKIEKNDNTKTSE